MRPNEKIQKLLISLFNTEELLRFLRYGPQGEEILSKLPSMKVSLDEIAYETIDLLQRYGLIDHAFFARLVRERPGRTEDINQTYKSWLISFEHKNLVFVESKFDLRPDNYPKGSVDALIITALKDELDAILNIGQEVYEVRWDTAIDSWGFPYHWAIFRDAYGDTRTFVATRAAEMGETNAATVATRLISELRRRGHSPKCLAMSGICAGRRGSVFLGDIIIAERLFKFDNGKIEAIKTLTPDGEGITETTVFNDIKTFNLRKQLKIEIEEFAKQWEPRIGRSRPKSYLHQRKWLLDKLYDYERHIGPVPSEHRERETECYSWNKILAGLMEDKLVSVHPNLKLTKKGRSWVEVERSLNPDGWVRDSQYSKVHIGPLGTNARVQKDPELFDRLQLLLRSILGIEMEGSAVGSVAEEAGIPCLIAKAVVDFADLDKNDNFRLYSCDISADFLLAFLLHSRLLVYG